MSRIRAAWDAFWSGDAVSASKSPSASDRSGDESSPYESGKVTELNRNWQPKHYSGDSAIDASWDLTTARVRDLVRNEPILRRARNKLARMIIGTGLQTFSNVEALEMEYSPHLEQFANESDEWFAHWADNEADVSGRMTWYEMQEKMVRDTAEVGMSLLLKCHRNEPGRSVSLCYQLIESEQLDRTKDRDAGPGENRVVHGIEVDRHGRAVGYWIYDAHPYDYSGGGANMHSTWVAATRIVPWFIPDRISSVTGISWFAPLVRPVKDADWYLSNELQAAAIGALLTLVYKSETATGMNGLDDGTSDTQDRQGNPLVQLGKAITATIGTDEELDVAESNRPNRNAAPFMQFIMHQMAMGADMSYIGLTGDVKGASYSSARQAVIQDHEMARPLQNSFGARVAVPVRREHNRQAAAAGLYRSVTPRQFEREEIRYQKMIAQPVGREHLDETKAVDAGTERLRTSRSTLQAEIGKEGGHWLTVLRQRRREMKTCERMGLTLDFSKGNGGNANDNPDQADIDEQREADQGRSPQKEEAYG